MPLLIMLNTIKVQVKKVYKNIASCANNEDVEHQDVKVYCTTNNFIEEHFLAHSTNHMVHAD